ncbi:MAG: BACON domain-containing protein [Muribaculaceae bacterium]|nr:BACON domain-containing protein [Muribaculaceae bacterium]
MKKYLIYGRRRLPVVFALLAVFTALVVSVTACSDNVEEGLEPIDDSKITLSVREFGSESNLLLEMGWTEADTVLNVICNTRWTVDVEDCKGLWCQVVSKDTRYDKDNHNGSFVIGVEPNRTDSTRECIVKVYTIDKRGNPTGRSVNITLAQRGQHITVIPAEGIELPYSGTSQSAGDTAPTVTVTANQPWEVSCSQEWLKVIPGSLMEGNTFTPPDGPETDVPVSFRLSAEVNPGTSARTAEVIISSPYNVFSPLRLSVMQSGSPEIFFVTPDAVTVIPYFGRTVEFKVYSPKDNWTTTVSSGSDWIKLESSSHNASTEAITIKAEVSVNSTSSPREGTVIFTAGDRSIPVIITQAGNSLIPVVSAAWIAGGLTSTGAQLHAYYRCPASSFAVRACGAVCQAVSYANEEMTFSGELISDDEITVSMTDLTPGTIYEARPYIEYTDPDVANSIRVYGTPVRFTTLGERPGIKPGEGDNNPPEIDDQSGEKPGYGDNNPPIVE